MFVSDFIIVIIIIIFIKCCQNAERLYTGLLHVANKLPDILLQTSHSLNLVHRPVSESTMDLHSLDTLAFHRCRWNPDL